MITTHSYMWPDGKTILCTVGTEGNQDQLQFKVQAEVVREIYRDLSLAEAVEMYAITKFTMFHNVDYVDRHRSWSYAHKRKSI